VITPSEGPLQRGVLRIGCGPLHAALLQSGERRDISSPASALAALQPLPLDPASPQQWLQLLQRADLDGLLLPAEALPAPATTSGPGIASPGHRCSTEPLQVVPLGSRPLVLLVHSNQLQGRLIPPSGHVRPTPPPPRLLLSPLCAHHQRRLAELALLPLEIEPCPTPQQLITRLSRERLLLPAPWDLLEHPPWCNTPLLPLPPPLPLHEQLVLLVSPSASQPAITALARALQQRINTQRQLLQRQLLQR